MPDWGGKVAAWFAGVATVSAALAALVGTASPPPRGWLHAVFVAVVIIAGISFVALLLTGPPAILGYWRSHRVGSVAGPPPAVPAPDPSEWISECNEIGDHGLLFTLRHRFENPAAIMAFGEKRCNVIDPDGITMAATGRALFYQYTPSCFPGASPVRSGTYRFTWEGRDARGAWREIVGSTHEVRLPALMIKLLDDPVWEAWQQVAMIVAFHIEVTNTTRVAVQVTNVGYGWVWPAEHSLDDEENIELARELHRRRERDHYGPPFQVRAPLPARASASGWLVTYMNRHPGGGTPEITIAIRDAVGKQYKHVIPAQEPQIHLA